MLEVAMSQPCSSMHCMTPHDRIDPIEDYPPAESIIAKAQGAGRPVGGLSTSEPHGAFWYLILCINALSKPETYASTDHRGQLDLATHMMSTNRINFTSGVE